MPSPPESKTLGALLLTGGASSRMGFAKAAIRIGGEPLAVRTARLARQVAAPVLEVGPGFSGLTTVAEARPGSGPLHALAHGVATLRALGMPSAALVLSTDLPALDLITLSTLAQWPGEHSVVPLWEGRPQPLCARWAARDLDAVTAMVLGGERSLGPLLARPGVELSDAFSSRALADVDTPADLDALGLDWAAP